MTIQLMRSTDDLASFCAQLRSTGTRKGFPVRPPAYFQALFEQYGTTADGLFVLARHHGVVVGGLVAAKLGASAQLLYSAVDRSRTADPGGSYPGPLLYWRFIQWQRSRGVA